uniref:hypothetical protein n=1 Tax=Mariniflexile sp. TaxID=1979402 RepID=UPI0035651B6A
KNLPIITKEEGKDYQKVSITQNGITTVVYFNLLADGRLKHRNSLINIEGWETDSYLTVLKFKEGADQSNIQNIEELFIGHGSYLRRDGQVLIHSLSKYTALVEDFQSNQNVIFQGQPIATFSLFSPKSKSSLTVNANAKNGSYDASNKLVKIKL